MLLWVGEGMGGDFLRLLNSVWLFFYGVIEVH